MLYLHARGTLIQRQAYKRAGSLLIGIELDARHRCLEARQHPEALPQARNSGGDLPAAESKGLAYAQVQVLGSYAVDHAPFAVRLPVLPIPFHRSCCCFRGLQRRCLQARNTSHRYVDKASVVAFDVRERAHTAVG